MPNIITHTLFADEVLEILKIDSLDERKQIFEIGSNGPDILFFHHMNPKDFYKKSRLPKLGSRLHSGNVNDFYSSAINSIWNEKDPEIKEDMIAYTAGHLCHWALDSSAHPLIYNRTGNCKGMSVNAHHRFESILDSLMLKLKKNETIESFDITKKVTDSPLWMKRAIARVYIPALNSIFDDNLPAHVIAETLDDWNFMQKLFRDPHNKKIPAAQMVDKLIGRPNQLAGYAVPNIPEDNYDIMNLKHELWRNPQTGQKSYESFLDLYDSAMKKALTAIPLFLKACAKPKDELAKKDLLDFVDNRNYCMGTSENKDLKYFDLIDLS